MWVGLLAMSYRPPHPHAAPHPHPPNIEVERKYAFDADVPKLRAAALAINATELAHVAFCDAYYDTPDARLTTSDVWLRRRTTARETPSIDADADAAAAAVWELKLPLRDAERRGGERTVFRELIGEEAVAEALGRLLPRPLGATGAPLHERLASAGVAPFGSFSTARSKWRCGNCAIDADIASFGHAVLELEVMCDDEAAVPAAEREIERVAALLGARALPTGTGGKMEQFLRHHCHDVAERLIAAGVLQPEGELWPVRE